MPVLVSSKTNSPVIENYLKEIYKLHESNGGSITTNEIADTLHTAPASVTDMLKKLAERSLIHYRKYQGVTLSRKGRAEALKIVRKHRLWERFLFENLSFPWDEVHEIAEQLEHIRSDKLIDKLDAFLHFPQFDPHGDPIPDCNGKFHFNKTRLLSRLQKNEKGTVSGVADHSRVFLRFLDRLKIGPGSAIKIIEKIGYDHSLRIRVNETKKIIFISNDVAKNILVIKHDNRKNNPQKDRSIYDGKKIARRSTRKR